MISSMESIQVITAPVSRPRFRSGPPRDGHRDRCSLTEHDPARRVYLASPLSTYQTQRYDAVLAQVEAQYPSAELLPARSLFQSTEDWSNRWPELLPTLTDLVFFAAPDGTVGFGVWCEVQDSAGCIPIWYVDEADRWHPLEDVVLEVTGESLRRFATVRLVDRPEKGSPGIATVLTGGA
jgi:hypothetical protein